LQDVYVDIETDEPQFGTVKEGVFNRHLTFVPLAGVQVSPQSLQVTATKEHPDQHRERTPTRSPIGERDLQRSPWRGTVVALTAGCCRRILDTPHAARRIGAARTPHTCM